MNAAHPAPPAKRLVRRRLALAATICLSLAGCAGYHVGAATLYPPDIHTVYVPMFESDSFRRGLGERLTEAVVKEIEKRTPYKVVDNNGADSVLTGRIITDTKRVIAEDTNDQPRETDINLLVQVTWVDRNHDIVGPGGVSSVPIPVLLADSSHLVPEYGQSTATAQQEAINRLATDIVNLMEMPPF